MLYFFAIKNGVGKVWVRLHWIILFTLEVCIPTSNYSRYYLKLIWLFIQFSIKFRKIHYVLQKWAFALQVQLAINEYEKENPCLLVVDWSKERRFSIFSP